MIMYLVFKPIHHWVYEAFTFNCEALILKTEDGIVWKIRTGIEYKYKGNKKQKQVKICMIWEKYHIDITLHNT
jgi:hypothetical protein